MIYPKKQIIDIQNFKYNSIVVAFSY